MDATQAIAVAFLIQTQQIIPVTLLGVALAPEFIFKEAQDARGGFGTRSALARRGARRARHRHRALGQSARMTHAPQRGVVVLQTVWPCARSSRFASTNVSMSDPSSGRAAAVAER